MVRSGSGACISNRFLGLLALLLLLVDLLALLALLLGLFALLLQHLPGARKKLAASTDKGFQVGGTLSFRLHKKMIRRHLLRKSALLLRRFFCVSVRR